MKMILARLDKYLYSIIDTKTLTCSVFDTRLPTLERIGGLKDGEIVFTEVKKLAVRKKLAGLKGGSFNGMHNLALIRYVDSNFDFLTVSCTKPMNTVALSLNSVSMDVRNEFSNSDFIGVSYGTMVLYSNYLCNLRSVRSIYLPISLKEIHSGSLCSNRFLEFIYIPESVDTISTEAIKSNTSLRLIVAPERFHAQLTAMGLGNYLMVEGKEELLNNYM